MIKQNLLGMSFDIAPVRSDPLHELGALCGLEDLRTNAEGLCCLVFGTRIVHLQRWPHSSRIRLSSEVAALPVAALPGVGPVRESLQEMRRDGIALRILHADAWCVQSVFDGLGVSEDDGAAGASLLAAIERLLRHAQAWQRAASAPGASVLPAARRGSPAFRRRG
ncbi:type III secretion system chaperone [Robbsia sp. Bb-Pol-6]|uniref:Type III secretion system chaperone n=1 Tax=Robbsia betulipollinis TaxID=2981849 RepID=A0ABT3ZL79_9BURK|nr:type III secretion system chaperone [Robbsia betulipollinis]MCY0387294.1 type III secretion system chaperone [Robbsia betulipollinis]